MFFITTDTNKSVNKLFSRIFNFTRLIDEKTNPIIIKHDNLNAVFYNCQKIELSAHTVIISGNVFSNKDETLTSTLERVVQREVEADTLNGNFNLIVFNKNLSKDNAFSIISDRHGTIPCFFSQENNVIEVSSVLHLFFLDKEYYRFNEQSLLDYLCLGCTLPEKSLWHLMEILPKGKFLTIFPDQNHLTIKDKFVKKSEKIKGDTEQFLYLKDCASVFFKTLREVVQDEINSLNVNYMLLTGGSDTRMLLSCMNDEQRRSLIYRTYDSPYWSSSNNDLLVAKLIVEAFSLHHETYSKPEDKNKIKLPQSNRETQYTAFNKQARWISGQFGSELFGGASLDGESLALGYSFSKRLDTLKDKLLNSLITSQSYKKIGSPWSRLNQKILAINSTNKEVYFVQQMLLRSQFTSIYSTENVHTFIIPSRFHFSGSILPYIDTRIIDFFLRCPREFLLNYSLYEHVFTHFSDKRLTKIPFHSNMMKFIESLPKINEKEMVIKNVGTESKCNYREYFEQNFMPNLFEGTFLEKLSCTDGHKIPKPFLSRICDLNCFLLGLRNR